VTIFVPGDGMPQHCHHPFDQKKVVTARGILQLGPLRQRDGALSRNSDEVLNVAFFRQLRRGFNAVARYRQEPI
jgi:hypothetical protein